jgi:type IV pilus assembly protein PilB
MNPKPNDFCDYLEAHGAVEPEQRNALRSRFPGDDLAILMDLIKRDPRRRDTLGRLYGDYLGVAYVDCGRTLIHNDLTARLPEQFARKRHLLPLYEFGGAITVASATPKDRHLLAEAENFLGTFLSPVFAFPDQIDAAIEIVYQSDSELARMIADHSLTELAFQPGTPIKVSELKRVSEDRAIIDFTRGLILLALKHRASDIHIEPGEEATRVRFRIDGVLQEILKYETPMQTAIVARLKVMAEADISETRRPQDGRLTLVLPDRSIDIRMATIPVQFGEKVVLRILGQAQFESVPDLTELDFAKPILTGLRRIVDVQHGIFFVTGPTGSGKTTTLYALLKYLNHPGVNILTIENPVEYRLAGINQVQTNEAIDLDFSQALRAFLRLDPDIILVGEVRDFETAQIACRAALTGHLVLTTMHTNDSLQAVLRLVEMGIDSTLAAPALIGVMAQRLVRRLCPHCKVPVTLKPEEIERYFEWDGKTPVQVFRAQGCERCNRLGYLGRIAIHEMVLINDALRAAIIQKAPVSVIREQAVRDGFTNLHYDGIKKVLRGLTTFDEIEHACAGDE